MQQTHYVAVLFVKEKKRSTPQCVSHKKIHWHNYLFDICFQVHFGVDTHTLRLWMYVLQLLILFSLELAQSHLDEKIFH